MFAEFSVAVAIFVSLWLTAPATEAWCGPRSTEDKQNAEGRWDLLTKVREADCVRVVTIKSVAGMENAGFDSTARVWRKVVIRNESHIVLKGREATENRSDKVVLNYADWGRTCRGRLGGLGTFYVCNPQPRMTVLLLLKNDHVLAVLEFDRDKVHERERWERLVRCASLDVRARQEEVTRILCDEMYASDASNDFVRALFDVFAKNWSNRYKDNSRQIVHEYLPKIKTQCGNLGCLRQGVTWSGGMLSVPIRRDLIHLILVRYDTITDMVKKRRADAGGHGASLTYDAIQMGDIVALSGVAREVQLLMNPELIRYDSTEFLLSPPEAWRGADEILTAARAFAEPGRRSRERATLKR